MRDSLRQDAETKIKEILESTGSKEQNLSYIMAVVLVAYQNGQKDAINKPGRWG